VETQLGEDKCGKCLLPTGGERNGSFGEGPGKKRGAGKVSVIQSGKGACQVDSKGEGFFWGKERSFCEKKEKKKGGRRVPQLWVEKELAHLLKRGGPSVTRPGKKSQSLYRAPPRGQRAPPPNPFYHSQEGEDLQFPRERVFRW